MKERTRALLLVGSPRAARSTSASLGTYLLDRLSEKGLETETAYICPLLGTYEGRMKLLSSVDNSDILILSFPLYVDSLPAGVTKALELIAEHRRPSRLPPAVIKGLKQLVKLLEEHNVTLALVLIGRLLRFLPPVIRWILQAILQQILEQQKLPDQALRTVRDYLKRLEPKEQRLVAISNSGFPEARQSNTALAICERFAAETGIEWAGGLALGAGSAIDGKPLRRAGGMVRNVMKALDLAAVDISQGRPVSEEAITLMAKPMMPTWIYMLFGSLGWRIRAWKNRMSRRLHDRSIQEEHKDTLINTIDTRGDD